MKSPRCCTICKNHGQKASITSHICPFTDCRCSLCQLTRLSRRVMCHQQRLWRHKKLDNKGSSAPEDVGNATEYSPGGGQAEAGSDVKTAGQKRAKRDVVCDKCRNHDQWVQKRGHKGQCPFEKCDCSYCAFTNRRQRLMKHQQRVRRAMVTPGQHDTSEVEQLSKEVFDMPLNPSTSEPPSALTLSSSLLMSSPSSHFSPISTSAPLPSLPPCYSSSISSPIVPSSFSSFTAYSCTALPSTSLSSHYVGVTEEKAQNYLPIGMKPSSLDIRNKGMAGDGAAHTQPLTLPHPVTSTAPLSPHSASSPTPPLYSSVQGNHTASNSHDPKEVAEQHNQHYPDDSPSKTLLVTQELEALHMREERERLPSKILTPPSINHRVLRPHPIGRPWLLHPSLYPEWGSFYQTSPPQPPPHPPPPPPSYSLHTLPTNRDATQAHVTPWYPGTWCLHCRLQGTHMHQRSYSCVPHDLSNLPSVTSHPVPLPISSSKESAFSGSHLVHTSKTLTPHK